MAQTSRPSSDVSQTGAWSSTGGSFYTEIDESVASDADYIKYDYPGVELNSVIVGLAPISAPGVHTGHTFYFRAKFDPVGPASSDPDLTVSLMEGGDVISSSTVTLGSTYVNYSKTLSEPEAANITDYTNLRLMFSVSDGASLYDYFVAQAYLETPDAAASSGGFDVSIDDILTGKGDLKDKRIQVGADRRYQFNIKESFGSQTDKVMKWAEPESEEDALNGKICSFSGHWFPSRLVIYIEGRPYGEPFAPFPNTTQGYGLDPEVPGEQ